MKLASKLKSKPGVYKITNLVNGKVYIGSSNNLSRRIRQHKWYINSSKGVDRCDYNLPMYVDIRETGRLFQIEIEYCENYKEREQYYIELLKPEYNHNNAIFDSSEQHKKELRQYQKQYREAHKEKECQKLHNMSLEDWQQLKQKKHEEALKRSKEKRRINAMKYNNQICLYNGEEIKLITLSSRFRKLGIPNPSREAKKYLIS